MPFRLTLSIFILTFKSKTHISSPKPLLTSTLLRQSRLIYIKTFEPWYEISNNVVCATSKGSDQPAHTRSLIRAFVSRLENFMTVKLLIEQNLEFLSLTESCTGSSESALVKMPRCWKSHVTAHLRIFALQTILQEFKDL